MDTPETAMTAAPAPSSSALRRRLLSYADYVHANLSSPYHYRRIVYISSGPRLEGMLISGLVISGNIWNGNIWAAALAVHSD